jgi:uncharacterized membrane protein (DUF4010 family)
MSRQSRAQPEHARLCALAVVLACTVMLARVAVLVGTVSPAMIRSLGPALLVVALPGLLFSLWSWRRFRQSKPASSATQEVKNPLSLRVALQFALLYALIVLLVRWANDAFGGAGLYWASFLSGLTDLDAISLSLSQMQSGGGLGVAEASRAILIAAGANSLLKGAMAVSLGGAAMRRPTAIVLAATVLLAALAAWVV